MVKRKKVDFKNEIIDERFYCKPKMTEKEFIESLAFYLWNELDDVSQKKCTEIAFNIVSRTYKRLYEELNSK